MIRFCRWSAIIYMKKYRNHPLVCKHDLANICTYPYTELSSFWYCDFGLSKPFIHINITVFLFSGASYFNKIVGGQTADIKEIPYQAAILVDYNRNGQFSLRCGGSIISDKVILTAAYCPGE